MFYSIIIYQIKRKLTKHNCISAFSMLKLLIDNKISEFKFKQTKTNYINKNNL